jgi:hypothetical protein
MVRSDGDGAMEVRIIVDERLQDSVDFWYCQQAVLLVRAASMALTGKEFHDESRRGQL